MVGVATIETEVTPADAIASITQPLALSNVAPFAGMITSVLGGGLFTMIVTGALVPLTPFAGGHALKFVGAVGHTGRVP